MGFGPKFSIECRQAIVKMARQRQYKYLPKAGTGMKKKNVLYYGDNLDIMQRHIRDGSVDLIYLDPPGVARRPKSRPLRTPGNGIQPPLLHTER
jgi:hypothetical protein